MKRAGLRLVAGAPPSQDAADLARIARGELDGLGGLFDRHAQALHAFVRRATPREDADDVVQTVFVRLVDIARGYDGRRGSARAWLFGVALRVMQERRRSFARLARTLLDLATLRPREASDATAARLELEQALGRLSEPKRIALLLAEGEGFSGPEIAEILGVPLGTVWTRLHHARLELRTLSTEEPR